MRIRHRGAEPSIDPSAWVAPELFVPPMTVAIGAAFGVEHEWTDRTARYERMAEVRVAEFAEHASDEIIEA
ncbi:hypothetical protein [Dactylosporangium sp. CA-139066]|uniref:hypothetical protein n=1 Tax=Dactylosporangium sp. CA-139066 TaxID=3239930 RepID=UPI003D906C48